MSIGKLRGPAFRFVRVALIFVLIVLVLPYLLAPLYRFVDPPSTLMLWRRITFAPVQQTWLPLAAISPALPRAVLVAEDARFCSHRGVDLGELRAALEDADNLSGMRGGSTIAQQTVKNLFLWPGRSFVRKALEFPLALWFDLVVGKRRVIEIYLNVAEWGPNGQFGAEAGARHAFGKSARDLSSREAALLAAILPNPIRRSAGKPGSAVRRLGGIYEGRARKSGPFADCVRR
jgi:monofunctional biosynthetic peptidoglycan transglycosylase